MRCQPVVLHVPYKVHLDKRDASNDYLSVGATTAAPDTLTLPGHADEWTSAVVINDGSVDVNGKNVS